MNLGRLLSLKIAGLVLTAPVLLAADSPAPRPPIPLSARHVAADAAMRTQTATPASTMATCSGICYSAELSQVVRKQGAAFYRTAVDISNNTTHGGVLARIQFSYANAGCTGGFCRTSPLTIPLAGLDNFHQDDMVQFLDNQGLLAAGAVNDAVGTLLVTFDNLPSSNGWEGTAVARLYNRVNEQDASLGTVGYAFPASLFFESAYSTLVGIVRDTTPAAVSGGVQGSQRTNLGFRNTDIHAPLGSNRPVDLQVSFYDVTEGSPTNGQRVGNFIGTTGLLPGQVQIIGNVFQTAAIPASVTQCIVFVDVVNPQPAPYPANNPPSPTVEGFIVTIDNVTTDGSYFEMKCADEPYTCGL